MIIFDQILPIVTEVLNDHHSVVDQLDWLLINRDLNGRIRLILPESIETDDGLRPRFEDIYRTLGERIAPHAFPAEHGILYEAVKDIALQGAASRPLEGFKKVWVVDRLATEGKWAPISPETKGPPRVVFFSIKGGVGRSTALAATAWTLAEAGKRVLVLDLDLESPGLSSSLLSPDRQPAHGITDWLVEDLVNNAEMMLENMIATSGLSQDGEIFVVPAHGADPGEYISKLGRVWMPKVCDEGRREPWSARLLRLISNLEERICPDVVLIDSRAGIDEVASSCVTDLGATLLLLFTLEGSQTWNGYRILFEHWQRAHVAQDIRERLKIVAALVPETERPTYLEQLREHSYGVFIDTLYDEIAPPPSDAVGPVDDGGGRTWRVDQIVEGWNFDEADEGAPHHPWPVYWHRSFAGLRSLQGRLLVIDAEEVRSIFGPLIRGVIDTLDMGAGHV